MVPFVLAAARANVALLLLSWHDDGSFELSC